MLVSQTTQKSVVVPVSTAHHWTTEPVTDKTRNISYQAIFCPREHLRGLDELAAWLKMSA